MNRTRLLAILAVSLLATGCSVAVKGGLHTFTSSDLDDFSSAAVNVVGVDIGLREFLDKKVYLDLGVDFVDAPSGSEFNDYRLTARYKFRDQKRFSPYAGGGIGWFRWFANSFIVIDVPACRSESSNVCQGQVSDTVASGTYPHAVGGLDIKLTRSVAIVVEDRYDFAKKDGGLDFDGNRIMAGFRFDWGN